MTGDAKPLVSLVTNIWMIASKSERLDTGSSPVHDERVRLYLVLAKY